MSNKFIYLNDFTILKPQNEVYKILIESNFSVPGYNYVINERNSEMCCITIVPETEQMIFHSSYYPVINIFVLEDSSLKSKVVLKALPYSMYNKVLGIFKKIIYTILLIFAIALIALSIIYAKFLLIPFIIVLGLGICLSLLEYMIIVLSVHSVKKQILKIIN